MSDFNIPTYQHYDVMKTLVDSLRPHLGDGEKIIWRDAFRWKDDQGVLSNHYEACSIEYLCEEFGYELIHNFNHVAVVRDLNH